MRERSDTVYPLGGSEREWNAYWCNDRDLLLLIIENLREGDYFTSHEAIVELFPSIVWC